MFITIQNEAITLTVDTLGAQMMSLQTVDGVEYLWQGDPQYWEDRAPVLFPFIARLYRDTYRLNGKSYKMKIHGFAASSEFAVKEQGEDFVTLRLENTPKTYAVYPCAFALDITYRLVDKTVEVIYEVINQDAQEMHFAIGGHPGFCVPLEDGERFEDYRLAFGEACVPDRIGFTEELLLSGCDQPYPLEHGKEISLDHSLFDEDAIILKNMAKKVTLCGTGKRSVTVEYPDMPYLGIWHWPKTDAPYVCIEPWTSLPARQDIEEEFSCKSDMIHLLTGETYKNMWSISVT